jgi:hypothetical protein
MNDTLTPDDDLPVPGVESDADMDAAALLAEYQEGKTPPPEPPAPDNTELFKQLKPIVEYAQTSMRTDAAKAEQDAVDSAVNLVKEEEALANVPNSIVEGFLQNQYTRNPDFKTAYDKRVESPDGWNQALGKAKEALAEEIGHINPANVKDDVEAALATVKGTSETDIEDAQDIKSVDEMMSMSDVDFTAYKRTLDR